MSKKEIGQIRKEYANEFGSTEVKQEYARLLQLIGTVYIGTKGIYRKALSGSYVLSRPISEESTKDADRRFAEFGVREARLQTLFLQRNDSWVGPPPEGTKSLGGHVFFYIALDGTISATSIIDIESVHNWKMRIIARSALHNCSRAKTS